MRGDAPEPILAPRVSILCIAPSCWQLGIALGVGSLSFPFLFSSSFQEEERGCRMCAAWMPHVCDVQVRGDYRLWLRFSDGAEGETDLGKRLSGLVFQLLRDPTKFAAVRADPEIHITARSLTADRRSGASATSARAAR